MERDCNSPSAFTQHFHAMIGWICIALLCTATQPALILAQSAHTSAHSPPEFTLDAPTDADLDALSAPAPGGPAPVALARSVSESLHTLMHWAPYNATHQKGRVRITSRGATTLNLGFRPFDLPEGARLTVSRPDGTQQRGPYRADQAGSALFTPMIEGETALVTILLPHAVDPAALQMRLVHVGHGEPSEQPAADPLRPQASGSCNVDVACPEADDWSDPVRAVGRITFVRNGQQLACSGALIATTEGPTSPYVLTAQHCIDTPDVAETAVFYWNYEHPSCRPPGSSESGSTSSADPFDQTSTGAQLRASVGGPMISDGPDITLLEVQESLSPAFDLFYTGWTRADTAPDASTTIHHPGGYAKRISFDFDPPTITGYAEFNSGDTHLRVSDWDVGTTEPGSSGGPLLDPEQRIAGVLSGGFAACGVNEPDWYGRLAVAWEGSTSNERLRDWLDPASTDAETADGHPQGGHIDPPPGIDALTLATTDDRSATLSWTVPDYTSTDNPLQAYRVRVDTAPIETETDFEAARPVPAPPPLDPGDPQSVTVEGLWPDSSYAVAVQTQNEAGRSTITSLDAPVELEDRIPPAPIADFSVDSATSDAVTLMWTATGAVADRGQAERYELRYAATALSSADDFATATPVSTALPPPEPAGTTESITVHDLPADTPTYFGLIAVDAAGNRSKVATTTDPVALIDQAREITGPIPNPVRSSSQIEVVVDTPQTLRIRLYDTLGRAVGRTVDANVQAFQPERIDLPTSDLASGTYFARISGDTFTTTRRVVVVR